MAEDKHVLLNGENKTEENVTRKLQKTVLDSFSNLVKNNDQTRVKSALNLIKHLQANDSKENNEIKYALGRLIRGLGSSKLAARTGFYSTLVALLNIQHDISVDDLFQHVDKELHKAGSNTKGENADVCTGQVLACGAIINSGLYYRSSKDNQKKVLELLIAAGKERIYLALLSYTFLLALCEQVNVKEFEKTILPLILPEISKPWAEQSLDTLYVLIGLQKKFPNLVKGKLLKKTLGTTEIVSASTSKELSQVLMSISRISAIEHPLYEIVAKDIASADNALELITQLDEHLNRPSRNRHLVIIKILTIILENLKNPTVIPQLLAPNFIHQTLCYFKTFKGKQRDVDFQKSIQKLFETLVNALKPEEIDQNIKVDVLKRLLFHPGNFIFEKITNSKLVQQITACLNCDGVKKMAQLYMDVASKGERINNDMNEKCLNMDRLYAAHLLIKLLNHPSMSNENEWKAEQIISLMNLGLLKENDGQYVGCELAASLKEAFYRSLDLKLIKLGDLQSILQQVVENLDSRISAENLETMLRSPITIEDYQVWQKTITTIGKISKKKKKSGTLKSVFLTLFLHMGLQLFNDTKLASESLKELFSCYERIKSDKKSKHDITLVNGNDDEEDADSPMWIEVVVDLFLNLLSHNSHLLRNIINCVFPHLCEYMNGTAVHQILSVLDPKNENNPLSRMEDDDSSEDDEDEEKEEDDDDDDEEEEDDEEEDMDENVNDKLKMALQKALSAGAKSDDDDESIDLDQMSDTEGEKLDEALAEAFRQYKPNKGKGKKQNKDSETLTHFRTRVLDLIEIYLSSTPSMLLSLEIMLPLLQAVEFSVRDEHQKPLNDRLKSCLKKISALRKFSSTEDVNETILTDLLNSLLEKGTKSSFIVQEMDEQISDCCIFVIRCSQILAEENEKKDGKRITNSISAIIVRELENYFTKNNYSTPFVLFKSTLQLTWSGNLRLNSTLLSYVHNKEIKQFRRNQALELLKLFYTQNRYLSLQQKSVLKHNNKFHKQFSEETVQFLEELCEDPNKKNVKERFITNLFLLLSSIKTCAVKSFDIDWPKIAELVRNYRSHVQFSKDGKLAYNKLCSSLQVSHQVQMKDKVIKLSKVNNDDDDEEDDGKTEEDGEAKKDKKKKNKQQKNKNKDKLKLKKEAKAMRLQSLSEGFSASVAFRSGIDVKESEDEDEEAASKVNGNVSEDNASMEIEENGVSQEKPKKRKNKSNKEKGSTKKRKSSD